ncbi:MAG: hypothetical protein RMI78_05540 [Nitrososphaerota archaeon]|nr:hypothetical protein [Nitrososphaerota archaeon]
MDGSFSRRYGKRSLREGEHQLIVEVAEYRDPELLMKNAAEAMKILENSKTDENLRAFALGRLCMSNAFVKFWRFYWPPRVELEWCFDDRRSADALAEAVGKFEKVTRATRIIDGKEYPNVRVDWRFWHALCVAVGAPIPPLDVIAANYIQQKNRRNALEQLARDLLLFMMTVEGDLRIETNDKDIENR